MSGEKPATLVGAWTDALNLSVASYVWPRPSREKRQRFESALKPTPDPNDLAVYFMALLSAWRTLLFVSLLLMVGFAFTGDRIAGNTGNNVGGGIGLFAAGFCLVGEFDATWRYNRARRARLLLPALTERESDRATRLARQARMNIGSIVLQLIGGLVVVAIFLAFL